MLMRSIGLSSAAMRLDDGPLAALAHPDGHGLHLPAAVRGAVPGFIVQMQAGQAVWAVVAVLCARRFTAVKYQSSSSPLSIVTISQMARPVGVPARPPMPVSRSIVKTVLPPSKLWLDFQPIAIKLMV